MAPESPPGSLARDVAAICVAVGVVGLSFGALATAAGLSVGTAAALSLLVLAGGSQFLLVAVLAAGAGPWAGVIGGLLINARHLPFGVAMAGVVGRSLPARLIGAHLLIDEVVAFARAQPNPARARTAYWTCGIALAVTWNVATVAGAWLGEAVPDPRLFGVDAAFPAALLALLLPHMRGNEPGAAESRRVGITGSIVAVALTPWLPAGLPLLAALAGVAAARRPPGGRGTP